MAESELNLQDILERLPAGAETAHLSADLWPRIATAHLQRQRRRRVQRFLGTGMAAAALLTVAFVIPWQAKPGSPVDWQARAQALEIQLNTLSAPRDGNNVLDAELARIDAALQSAYDRGAATNELVPLWKQRSDLLGALLISRQQQVTLTRI
jgi:hypothetical protein